MIICITDWFPVLDGCGFPTGKKELLVSHGIDLATNNVVVLQNEHPDLLGAKYDETIGEYIIK